MKIALVVPPWIKVPPERYGGIEAVIGLLAEGLVNRGHNVTIYTVGLSRSEANIKWIFTDEMFSSSLVEMKRFLNAAITHTLWSYLDINSEDYDIIHDNTWKEGLVCGYFIDTPIVHTIHNILDEENKRFYDLFTGVKHINFVTVSNFLQDLFPGLNYAGTVYNGIDLSKYPFEEEKNQYFLYLGRFNKDKAPHIACKIASELNLNLYLAGKVKDNYEKEYFNHYITPYLGDNIVFLGEVSEEEKISLFAHAKAYLFPIQWDEPFGLTMVEALACGTPVITFRRGSTPEIIEHEKTGFVVDTIDEFIETIYRLDEIDPKECRKRAESMFSPENLVNGYEEIYRKIITEQGSETCREYHRTARIGS